MENQYHHLTTGQQFIKLHEMNCIFRKHIIKMILTQYLIFFYLKFYGRFVYSQVWGN